MTCQKCDTKRVAEEMCEFCVELLMYQNNYYAVFHCFFVLPLYLGMKYIISEAYYKEVRPWTSLQVANYFRHVYFIRGHVYFIRGHVYYVNGHVNHVHGHLNHVHGQGYVAAYAFCPWTDAYIKGD